MRKKVLRGIISFALILTFLYSGTRVIKILLQYQRERKSYESIQVQYTKPAAEKDAPPITVDFDALQERYPDVIGWLYCEGTPINYPVCRGETNEEYLTKSPDGQASSGGSLFADVRCGLPDLADELIIYGHNMRDGSMFGALTKYKEQTFYDEHPEMWFCTPSANYKVELLGGFVMDSEAEPFLNVDGVGFHTVLREQSLQSTFTPAADVPDGERILVLSTCSYEYLDARFVVVGALQQVR